MLSGQLAVQTGQLAVQAGSLAAAVAEEIRLLLTSMTIHLLNEMKLSVGPRAGPWAGWPPLTTADDAALWVVASVVVVVVVAAVAEPAPHSLLSQ